MPTSDSPEPGSVGTQHDPDDAESISTGRGTSENVTTGTIAPGGLGLIAQGMSRSSAQQLAVLRLDIHGSWSVADIIKLLGRIEDGYKAAAALEELSGRPSTLPSGHAPRAAAQESRSSSLSADELIQTVTAFKLGGGLRLGSVHYGSPGWLTFIGALNPLKIVAYGITDNRKINADRDEVRRSDEREREQQVMRHEEAMVQESRMSERQRLDHELQLARLQMEAERQQFEYVNTLIGRMSRSEQTPVAAQLIERITGSTSAIANDARIDGAKMLERPDGYTISHAPDQTTEEPDDDHDDAIPIEATAADFPTQEPPFPK